MTIDIRAIAQEEATHAADLNEATAGGGEYELPADGPAPARFIGYIETGKHERSNGNGGKVFREEAVLLFELVGPRHPPMGDGDTKTPHVIKVTLSAGKNYGPVNEKSGMYSTFKKMNWEGKARTFADLLGKPFLLTIVHEAWKSDPTKKSASVKDPNVQGQYFIAAPRAVDAFTGVVTELPVPEATLPLRLFLWNASAKNIGGLWQSLFIDGMWPERKDDKGVVTRPAQSKNVWQEKIKSAQNFNGSPIFEYLQSGGAALPLGAAAASAAAPAAPAADPLAGVN